MTHGTEQHLEDQRAGYVLLEWLSLLGWRVRLHHGADIAVAAEHVTSLGEELTVRVRAATVAEAAGSLFERVMAVVDAESPELHPAAV